MEYRKRCKVCGHIFCYTDEDLKNSNSAVFMQGIAAIGTMAGALTGNWGAARVNQEIDFHEEKKQKDFSHCPNCNSTDLEDVSDASGVSASSFGSNRQIAASINTNASVETLIKRIRLFLEDGDFKSASAYCEYALDMDPENGELYLLKQMAISEISSFDDMLKKRYDITKGELYQKIEKYGDNKQKIELKRIKDTLNRQQYERLVSEAKIESLTVEQLNHLVEEFDKLGNYEDAREWSQYCTSKQNELIKKKIEDEEKARIVEEEQLKIAREKTKKERFTAIVSVSIIAIVALIGMFIRKTIIPYLNYNKAVDLFNSGDYDEALSLIDGINDADVNVLRDDIVFEKQKSALLLSNVGDNVYFGQFYIEDVDNKEKQPIEWWVLDKKDNGILLLCRHGINYRPFNTDSEYISWEECSLRRWLNDAFLDAAFTDKEQSIIQKTTVSADRNPKYNTAPGNETFDFVFLLSCNEVNKYSSISKNVVMCTPTAYAFSQAGYDKDTKAHMWWLRTPGEEANMAACVGSDGVIMYDGWSVDLDAVTVRPALWINLE